MRQQRINVLMVPRGYWNQANINAFQKDDDKTNVDKEQPVFEYHGTVLEANKYEAADIDATLDDDIYSHLNPNQKEQLRQVLKKHEGLFQGKHGVFNRPDVTL